MPRMGRSPCRSSRLAGCFNGASASMPRMGRLTGLDATGIWRLQRGLGIDAEDGMRRCRQGSAPCCFNGASASMPRMEVDRMHDTVLTAVLQRGLGIDAEDGRVADRRGPAAESFNGASASMPRMGGKRQTVTLEQYASTGPRHRCRGWFRWGSLGLSERVLQRGLGIDAEDGARAARADAIERELLQRGLGIDAEDGQRHGRLW